MMMRHVTTSLEGTARCLRAALPAFWIVFFEGGGVSVDSWTPGRKCRWHRPRTGPHQSGLLWTPWTPRPSGRRDERSSTHRALEFAAAIGLVQALGILFRKFRPGLAALTQPAIEVRLALGVERPPAFLAVGR